MTILIALARDPYGFEADGQEDCECTELSFRPPSVWSQINDCTSLQNPMKYL